MSDDQPATAGPRPIPVAFPKMTETIAKFAEAFAKAQGEFPPIPKDSEVEVKSKEGKFLYRYKYADLTTIIDKTRPALMKNGISMTQGIVPGGFATTFLHSSGEFMQSGFVPCEIPKNSDMKQVAGLMTYVKRISLTAALGVSADEDVDAAANESNAGNSTQRSNGNAPPPKGQTTKPAATPSPAKPPPGPTMPMLKRLYAIGQGMSWTSDAIRVYSIGKVGKTPGELSKAQYDQLCTFVGDAPYDENQAAEIDALYANFTEAQLKKFNGSEKTGGES